MIKRVLPIRFLRFLLVVIEWIFPGSTYPIFPRERETPRSLRNRDRGNNARLGMGDERGTRTLFRGILRGISVARYRETNFPLYSHPCLLARNTRARCSPEVIAGVGDNRYTRGRTTRITRYGSTEAK